VVQAFRYRLSDVGGGGAAWIMIAVGGSLVIAAAVTGLPVLTAVAASLATLASAVGILVRRPPRPWAWWLLTVSAAMLAHARVTAALGPDTGTIAGAVRIADVRSIVFFSTIILGLVLLVGETVARRNLADSLDATIVALGTFLLMWLFLLGGKFEPTGGSLVTTFSRPIGLALVAGVLTRLIFVVERQTVSFRLLVAAVAFDVIGTLIRVSYPFDARIIKTGIVFTAYTVLLAAALLHPTSSEPLRARQGDISRFTPARAVAFSALVLLGPLSWVVAVVSSRFNPRTLLAFGPMVIISALITLLLLWRLSLITHLADRRADQLEAAQAELVYRATRDPLTGLGNRAQLADRLGALVSQRAFHSDRPGLVLLDLDGFKRINDSLGHPIGDELLIEVAHRLSNLAPPNSTVVRLGGDEFAILLADVNEPSALAVSQAVREELSQPYVTSRGPLSVTASIGVCLAPRVERSASEILRNADVALYAAKAAGKNCVKIFGQKIENARYRLS